MTDIISCKICFRQFNGQINPRHITKEHNITVKDYKFKYGLIQTENYLAKCIVNGRKGGGNENAVKAANKKSAYNKLVYYNNPKLCERCSSPIPYREHHRQKFCSSTCFAKTNNLSRQITKKCRDCHKVLINKKNLYCDKTCRSNYNKTNFLKTLENKVEKGLVHLRPSLRKHLIATRGYKCEICDISEWRGSAVPLSLDHEDGNATNNLPSNLRLLCMNCHGQTSTFAGRNYGKGRKSRGLSQQ